MTKSTQTLAASVAATTAMTLFSYMLTRRRKSDFREPELLAEALHRLFATRRQIDRPLAWFTHYLIGAGFSVGYDQLLKLTENKPSVLNGLGFGAAAGIAGWAGWRVLFKNHPDAPETNRKEFYTQLVTAHVVFGGTLVIVKKLLQRR